MKLPNLKILDEKNKILHQKSLPVSFPLTKEDKKTITDMQTYLKMSQISKYTEKYSLRPGMGLAYPQLGISKRIFVIVYEYEDGKFENYCLINPHIKSMSEEMIYVGEGEGCLSVNREIEGIVPRHARITIEFQDVEGTKQSLRVREDLAIAFQHELDHLDGILFVDRIDKKDPYKNENLMREI